ncbi:hypothetical protein SUGI_0652450 [Cryptomeria japonica]|uniref:uncharacterized protein LOC131031483 n=1 Tax=Cryptomeria japonica TaxID=3369 RepID=UPI002414697C|nr:uncharacterized protein LOC131031483 [Cryptomeria japonica]GLJ32427.1 hypothetical protein SUGI_0652450 [Cryptomeria japonica]
MADWQLTGGGVVGGGTLGSGGAGDADVVVNSKRQRRPSVRLGEIGDQSAAYAYDTTKRKKQQLQWNQTFFPRYAPDYPPGKLSKTRPLVNIGSDGQVVLDESIAQFGYSKMQLNPMCVSKKIRHGRTRRKGVGLVGKQVQSATRAMRVSPDSNNNNEGNNQNGHDKGSGDENGFGASYDIDTPDGFKDSDLDTSGSPTMKETCTIHLDSPDSTRPANLGGSSECQEVSEGGTWGGLNKKGGGSAEYGNDIVNEGMDLPSDVDIRSNKQEGGANGGVLMRGGLNGGVGVGDVDEKLMSAKRYFALARDVRSWLGGLGLGRYAELFEMHEVDKDVLPLLTLDDLREMGINAVGARRKIYSAIQKIGKRFPV